MSEEKRTGSLLMAQYWSMMFHKAKEDGKSDEEISAMMSVFYCGATATIDASRRMIVEVVEGRWDTATALEAITNVEEELRDFFTELAHEIYGEKH
jgi:alkylhydroperoxidase/carboxymuconolactone decarboxylase family protein YurZ